jgi:hypothetical protein
MAKRPERYIWTDDDIVFEEDKSEVKSKDKKSQSEDKKSIQKKSKQDDVSKLENLSD